MKTQLLMAIAILTSNFALPPLAFAQEKTATPAVPNPFQPIPAGPSLVQQLEAINEQFDEAFNKHDATAVAAFYTANAILSSPLAVASGLPDIEKYFTKSPFMVRMFSYFKLSYRIVSNGKHSRYICR